VNKKVLVLILLTTVLFLPFIANAASDIKTIVNQIAQSLSGLGAALATIGFVVAGILFIASTTNPSMMSMAKGALIAAVIGIVIILLAANACQFVQTFTGAGSC
jgi:type IV secretory pathway VirB2 component (pilin)